MRKNILILWSLVVMCGAARAETASSAAGVGWLAPTAELRRVGDFSFVSQNGLVYDIPSPGECAGQGAGICSALSLNGEWRALRAGMDHSLTMSARTPDARAALEAGGEHEAGFDDSLWEPAILPRVENLPPDPYVDGVWFRRSFTVPEEWRGKRVRLVFLGANYVADVWLNGEWLGWHEGGYTSFAFNASRALEHGAENVIAARVDNIPWTESFDVPPEPYGLIVPYANADWWNYGGIYRDVYLVAEGRSGIEDFTVETRLEGGEWRLTLKALAREEAGGAVMRGRLEGCLTARAGAGGQAEAARGDCSAARLDSDSFEITGAEPQADGSTLFALRASVAARGVSAWSPDNPVEYELALFYRNADGGTVDARSATVALRQIEVAAQGPPLRLNGEAFRLRGVNRHEELPGVGRAQSWDDTAGIKNDLRLIKELGANFVRAAHYPNHPAFFDLANREGFLTAEEIPVYWFKEGGFEIQLRRGIARQMWLEMIARDRRRPAAAFWSMGNETTGGEESVKFFRELMEDARALDGTRPVYHNVSFSTLWTSALAAGDLIALSLYSGVFDSEEPEAGTARVLKTVRGRHPDKAVLAAEYGIWTGDDEAGDARQVEILQKAQSVFKGCPFLVGSAWWAAFDYHSVRQKTGTFHRFGLYTLDRSRMRPSGEAIKKHFNLNQ
ncbi:MAG TPA: glycoside hydrolase family 2 TIM barrel-domain containing protein [bacterium]|nr:glycoside hydrolase family 2 TIM barrel-domain containing protein [bacterium]